MNRTWTIGGWLTLVVFLAAPGAFAREFTGENDLGVEPDLMRQVQQGLELIYQRQYDGAHAQFDTVKNLYPDSPAGPFGASLVSLSIMLENNDDELREEYVTQSELALELAELSLKTGQNKGWHTFLYACIVGIDGLDRAQQGDVLGALNKGWEAIESMKKAKGLEPTLADADLGIGIYNYWRTVVTEDVDFLPQFGDRRDEGLAQMQRARDEGVLVWVGGSLALAFAHKEARDYDKAIDECLALQAEYPDNVINNTLLGYLYAKNRDYDEAMLAYQRVREVDPNNRIVLWHIGELYYRTEVNDDLARVYFTKYLQLRIPTKFRSQTHDRLGEIAQRQEFHAEAIHQFEAAKKVNPSNKRARKHLKAALRKR